MKTKVAFLFFVIFFCNWSHAQLTSQFIQMKPRTFPTMVPAFTFTGSDQTWEVPANITSILVEAYGAQGGNRDVAGGLGGKVQAIVKVTPGETLYLMVGGQPSGTTAVYGNGGNAGTNASSSTKQGAAGGGMTALFRTSVSMSNVLVVAGGGGGAATGRVGGNAGGLVGNVSVSDTTRGGKGGTQSAGGAAGSALDTQITSPTSGLSGAGGTGGTINSVTWNSGAGGGAGFFGGGGGAGGGNYYGAGGGGSSYVVPTNTASIKHFTASNIGNGKMIIYY
ncbi:glycine rich domain-containing protein [Flavobacterium sp.]|uniref:glycine rich domain-containing protein n=1 Tax=Flavobacterium sp. TaxID=239 RepID=UPI0025FE1D3F|nr:glycine rich domain-containing protein [Flavobacterium sp.]